MSAHHRYIDTIAPERADMIRRGRWDAVSTAIAWVAIAILLASFAPHIGGF
jgi:hypothetical protein